jgi:hypothetical protein
MPTHVMRIMNPAGKKPSKKSGGARKSTRADRYEQRLAAEAKLVDKPLTKAQAKKYVHLARKGIDAMTSKEIEQLSDMMRQASRAAMTQEDIARLAGVAPPRSTAAAEKKAARFAKTHASKLSAKKKVAAKKAASDRTPDEMIGKLPVYFTRDGKQWRATVGEDGSGGTYVGRSKEEILVQLRSWVAPRNTRTRSSKSESPRAAASKPAAKKKSAKKAPTKVARIESQQGESKMAKKKTTKKAAKKRAAKKTTTKAAPKKLTRSQTSAMAEALGPPRQRTGPKKRGDKMSPVEAHQAALRGLQKKIDTLKAAETKSHARIATLEKEIRSLRAKVGAHRRRGDLNATQEKALKAELDKCRSAVAKCKVLAAEAKKATKRKAAKKTAKKATKKKAAKKTAKKGPRVRVGVTRVGSKLASARKKAAEKSLACRTQNPKPNPKPKPKKRVTKKSGNGGAVKCRTRPTQSSLAACRRAYQSWQDSPNRQAKKKKSARATCGPGVPAKKAAGYLGGKQKGKQKGKPRMVTTAEQRKIMSNFMRLGGK